MRLAPALLGLLLLASCGGDGVGAGPEGSGPTAVAVSMPPGDPARVVLRPPVLRFSDTGIDVADGLTANGTWWVETPQDLNWEYSLDLGRTWIRGAGDSFRVTGDGPKLIWARSFDGQGNTSEIVMVTCTLDMTPPSQPQVGVVAGGTLPTLRIDGLEATAGWEYSVDEQHTWIRGTGRALALAGNLARRLWTRQVDAAGNTSPPVATSLDDPASGGWIEVSGEPLGPTVLPRWEGTLLLHGEVARGDMDFVRFDVPAGLRLRSLRLVHYASPDPIAFYALQRAPVFDAGVDVQRMLSWKHLGPGDLLVELLAGIAATARGDGPYTLWINQTGADRTAYAIEIGIGPD
jgi:hypothetical protein